MARAPLTTFLICKTVALERRLYARKGEAVHLTYLPTIDFLLGQEIHLFLVHSDRYEACFAPHAPQKRVPYLPASLLIQLGIVQRNVHPAPKGRVVLLDAVRREHQDPLEIFHMAEENTDEGVPVDVGSVALLQEDVRLVQQHHSPPALGQLHDKREPRVDLRGRYAQLAC